MYAAKRVDAPAPPAHTLFDQRRNGNRRQPLGKRLLDCIAAIIQRLDPESRLKVLGDCTRCDTADAFQGLARNHCIGTRIEHSIVAILAEIDLTEKVVLFIRNPVLRVEVVLKQVGIVKNLRRLNEADFSAVLLRFLRFYNPRAVLLLFHNGQEEIRNHLHQEVALRNHIGIKGCNQRRTCATQRVVDVACLRVLVVAEAEVPHTEFLRKCRHLRAIGIVTEKNMHLRGIRVVHCRTGICRLEQNIRLLVVRRNKDINIRKQFVRHIRHLRLIDIAE